MFATVTGTREAQALLTKVAISAKTTMIVGPDNVDVPTVRPICRIHHNPGLIAKGPARVVVKDADWLPKGSAAIIRGQDRDAAFGGVGDTRAIEHQRVDIVMQTKGKGDIRGRLLRAKTGKDPAILPGTASIEGAKEVDFIIVLRQAYQEE